MSPRLVLFDLDGTVLDGSGLPEAMRRTCALMAAGLPGVGVDDLVAANTAVWRRMWPEVEEDYLLGARRGDDVGRDAWSATLAACGIVDPASVTRAVDEWTRQEHDALRLFPDVLPALDELDRHGVRTGMVTNGAASVQRDKLEAVGLADRFDPLVVSGEVGVRKPDPAIFDIALAAARAPAAATWFVGDNLWHDVPGATEVGIRALWLNRDGRDLPEDGPQPSVVVASLDELAVLRGSAVLG